MNHLYKYFAEQRWDKETHFIYNTHYNTEESIYGLNEKGTYIIL